MNPGTEPAGHEHGKREQRGDPSQQPRDFVGLRTATDGVPNVERLADTPDGHTEEHEVDVEDDGCQCAGFARRARSQRWVSYC